MTCSPNNLHDISLLVKFTISLGKLLVYKSCISTGIVSRSRKIVLLSTATVRFSPAGCCLAYDFPDKSKTASCVSTDDRTAVVRGSRLPKFVSFVDNPLTGDRTIVARGLV